jgi:hypothetical protein
MKNKFLLVLILLSFNFANAKDVYDIPELKPILNPLYPADSELSLNVAYFPVGAFNKHLGFGASYMTFFGTNHAWEVLSAYTFTELPAGLKQTLVESYGATESNFAVLQSMVKTGYAWVPFYSKSILFNSSLIHSRTFLGVSAGIASYKIESPTLVSAGFAQDFYYGIGKGFKFAVDYIHFFKENKYIQNQITISFGLTFIWGGND